MVRSILAGALVAVASVPVAAQQRVPQARQFTFLAKSCWCLMPPAKAPSNGKPARGSQVPDECAVAMLTAVQIVMVAGGELWVDDVVLTVDG